MTVGMFLGFLLRNQQNLIKPVDPIITWSIYLLLFLLGVSVGINETIVNNFYTIGLKAAFLTLGAVMGSVVVSYFTYIIFFKKNEK